MPQMLGKRAAVHDPRTLKLRAYVTPDLGPIPEASDWAAKLGSTGPVFLNNKLGCCAISMVGNTRRGWAINNGQTLAITDDQILTDYEKIAGYQPGNPASDQGCVMLDVLKAWRRDGLCGGKIGAFASVQPTDRHMASLGVHIFGGLLMGVQLPAAVQGNQDEWKAPPPGNQFGEWAKGSWGGHAVVSPKYDPEWLYFWSWGKLMRMSWNFFASYSDETYVAVSADWTGPNFVAPNGLTINQMLQDVGAIAH